MGLLAFLTQILAENGCLLIGEIGQHLRGTFGKQDWSNILKERFGGLKRFLLKHSELFYVDTDHPLNPHIYLRASINGQPLLEKKPQDATTTTETKKSKKNKKQQNNNSHVTSSTVTTNQKVEYNRCIHSAESGHQPSYIQLNPSSSEKTNTSIGLDERQVSIRSLEPSLTSSRYPQGEELPNQSAPLYLQQPSKTCSYYSVPTEWLTREPMTSLIERCDNCCDNTEENATAIRHLPSSSFDYGFGPCNSF